MLGIQSGNKLAQLYLGCLLWHGSIFTDASYRAEAIKLLQDASPEDSTNLMIAAIHAAITAAPISSDLAAASLNATWKARDPPIRLSEDADHVCHVVLAADDDRFSFILMYAASWLEPTRCFVSMIGEPPKYGHERFGCLQAACMLVDELCLGSCALRLLERLPRLDKDGEEAVENDFQNNCHESARPHSRADMTMCLGRIAALQGNPEGDLARCSSAILPALCMPGLCLLKVVVH